MRKKLYMRFQKVNSIRVIIIAMLFSIFLAIVITGLGMAYYKLKVDDIELLEEQNFENYEQHYALITGDDDYYFWDSVYQGALKKGKELNIYVEKFGSNLTQHYSTNELFKMAIIAKVDGIIVQANNDEETRILIDEAVEKGIPVVTVLEDAPQSRRQCFVGVNNYNLGKEYGSQTLEAADSKTKKVMVLLDSNSDSTIQNIILSGIKEKLNNTSIEIQTVAIDRQNTFSSEEAIRDIIMDSKNLPNTIICLNSADTICAYQAIVDFNKVGEIDIIGYYNSETVLSAIEKKIIYSTIVIDTEEMGAYCVQAVDEYVKTSRVSDYISVDTRLIREKNVDEYLYKEQISGEKNR